MPTMKVIRPDGTVLELTVEQAIALGYGGTAAAPKSEKPAVNKLFSRGKKRAKVARNVRTHAKKVTEVAKDPNPVEAAISLLSAIRDAGKTGIGTEKVTDILGVSQPKAIASKSMGINRLLDDMEFTRRSIYSNDRTANGRVWKPGRNIQAALDELNKLQTAH
jgi:hypothetical protein